MENAVRRTRVPTRATVAGLAILAATSGASAQSVPCRAEVELVRVVLEGDESFANMDQALTAFAPRFDAALAAREEPRRCFRLLAELQRELADNGYVVAGATDAAAIDRTMQLAEETAATPRRRVGEPARDAGATAEPRAADADPTVAVDAEAADDAGEDTTNVEVTVPAAEVTVTQPATDVTVDAPEPEVAVAVPEPSVEVEAPTPVVDVEREAPTVAVEEPAPTVVVEEEPATIAVDPEPVVVEREPIVRPTPVVVERARPVVAREAETAVVEIDRAAAVALTAERLAALQAVSVAEVEFPFDSAALETRADLATLREVAAALSADPTLALLVVGYASPIGDFAYNQRLSEARTATVLATLQRLGAERERMRATSLGERNPEVPAGENERSEDNRRVELRLVRAL